MWPVLIEFRSATSEGIADEKEEDRRRRRRRRRIAVKPMSDD